MDNMQVRSTMETDDEIRSRLVDPMATTETVALFRYLKTSARRGTLIGQQDSNVTCADSDGEIRRITGHDPDVWGSDFMHITHKLNIKRRHWLAGRKVSDANFYAAEEAAIVQRAVRACDKGIVNVFCWHLFDPDHERTFYAAEMPEQNRQTAFRSLLPGGRHHTWYKRKLEKIAEVLAVMTCADGTLAPVIFRPFHESDADHFWWGAPYCSAQEFRDCWSFTVEYLRDTLHVHSLLYAFALDATFETEQQYLDRYPGDAYVDVVGLDDYADFENNRIQEAAARLAVVSAYAKRQGKISALTEVGYRPLPVPARLYTDFYGAALADPSLEIAFMMFWQAQDRRDGGVSFVPPPDGEAAEDFLDFWSSIRPTADARSSCRLTAGRTHAGG
jgi:mannan endo-1,4-beta-mannosidase